jgi:hypothetical protein
MVKRIAYLAVGALLAMLILAPGALAQDALPGEDDDPLLPEPNAVVVDEDTLQQIAGQLLPSQPPAGEPLPKTGGPEIGSSAWAVILPASALLLSLGILAYSVSRRRG